MGKSNSVSSTGAKPASSIAPAIFLVVRHPPERCGHKRSRGSLPGRECPSVGQVMLYGAKP